MNTDLWFDALRKENASVGVLQREERAEKLLELFSPLAISKVIACFERSEQTKKLAACCQRLVSQLADEYLTRRSSGKLPVVIVSKFDLKDAPTLVFEQLVKIIHMQPLPWLAAWQLGFVPAPAAHFEYNKLVSQRMQKHIQELLTGERTHTTAIYTLLSTESNPSLATLQQVKRILVTECAFIRAQEPRWISWDQLVQSWLRHENTPEIAKRRTALLYKSFDVIAFENSAEPPPLALETIEDKTTTFHEYVVQYSLHKIFADYLKIEVPEWIRKDLATYFYTHDAARKFAMYFCHEIVVKGAEAVSDIKGAPIIKEALRSLVMACEHLVIVRRSFGGDEDLSAYFELFYASHDEGIKFFDAHWPADSDAPIVPMRFKEAFDTIRELDGELHFAQQEKLSFVSHAALWNDPAELTPFVLRFVRGQDAPTLIVRRIYKEIAKSGYMFSYDAFLARYEEESARLQPKFVKADPVKRIYFIFHRATQALDNALISIEDGPFADEGAYIEAILYIRPDPGSAAAILYDIEALLQEVHQEVLSNQDRISFFAHAATRAHVASLAKVREETTGFLDSLVAYDFSLLQKALLLFEFYRFDLTQHRQFLQGFEKLFGHRLPPILAFSILFLHSVPDALLSAPEKYEHFRELIRNERKLNLETAVGAGRKAQSFEPAPTAVSRLKVPDEILEQVNGFGADFASQCGREIETYIEIDPYFASALTAFARLSLGSLKNNNDNEFFGLQRFFPHTIPIHAIEQTHTGLFHLLIPQFPDHSMAYRYTWEQVAKGFTYHLAIRSPASHELYMLDVTLEITRKELESNKNLAEVVHSIILLISNESIGSDTLYSDPQQEAKQELTMALESLVEGDYGLKLHLPWDENMWGYACKAYRFARDLRVALRETLCKPW